MLRKLSFETLEDNCSWFIVTKQMMRPIVKKLVDSDISTQSQVCRYQTREKAVHNDDQREELRVKKI